MNPKDLERLKKLLHTLTQNILFDEVKVNAETILHYLDQIFPKDLVPSESPILFPREIEGQKDSFALYSDGACRGNPGVGSWAYVIQDSEGNIINEDAKAYSMTTNNIMELSGALYGFIALRSFFEQNNFSFQDKKIYLVTDSQYVLKGLKEWVLSWEKKGWKKADGKAPENLELWQALKQIKDLWGHVEFIWVKGHSGHPQNEYCDKKANEILDLL